MTPPQPQDTLTLFNQGLQQLQAGNYSAALTYFDSALAINPNDPNIWEKRASALQNLGNYAAAIASNTIALSFYSGDIKFFDAEAWCDQGNQQAMAGDFVGAIASYDKALQFKPDDYEAWHNRGTALYHLGQFEQAIASYDKALEIKPDYHLAWNNRGNALVELGQFEEALASYDKALQFKPDYHEAWYNRGLALGKLGQLEEAIASYNKAIQIKPDYHKAWHNQGSALAELGQLEEAIASYNKAIQIKPDYHEAWHNRGVALENLGQFEEAIASYDKALEIKPDDYEAWHNRGLALENLGQIEEAIASYDKALQFKPDSYEAWLNRGNAAESSVNCDQLLASRSSIARQNPVLNQRGYEGALASYQEGLKHCHKKTHPEGWGGLHQSIGTAHYFQGRYDSRPHPYWQTAINSYEQALITLTKDDFPELHLEVLQDYIKPLLGLGQTAEAEELKRLGTDLLQRLLSEPKRTNYSKKQLALKFVSFQQLTVDQAVQSQQLVKALELAEKGKNACLTWLLDCYSEEISSPSYQEIQQLLNPTTAIIYWHLSPAALTTFIIKHGAEEPIVIKEPLPSPPVKKRLRPLPSPLLGENERGGEGVREERDTISSPPFLSRSFSEEVGGDLPPHDKPNLSFQHLHDFETWVNNWNKQYQEYRSKEKNPPPQPPLVRGEKEADKSWRDNLKRGEKEADKSWRDNLPEMLEHLGDILNIPAILSELTNINQLILIPHRDLHRFPLHALFPDNFTITYLPSALPVKTPPKPQ
ncbi:MAG TPA: tetratricopeptide repeat protein [Leptolyngbyaceae cyanobacterium]